MSIQALLAFDRFNLLQDRCDTLVVALDRNCFTASRVRPIAHGHDDNARFSASATRNAKRLFEWPDFFPCFDQHYTGLARFLRNPSRTEDSEFDRANPPIVQISRV